MGVTNDLVRRIHEHRVRLVKGFTRRYGLKMLVHFERYDDPTTAIQREKKYQALAAAVEARTYRIQ